MVNKQVAESRPVFLLTSSTNRNALEIRVLRMTFCPLDGRRIVTTVSRRPSTRI